MESSVWTVAIVVGAFVFVYGGSFLAGRRRAVAAKLLAADPQALVVDVRSAGEYREGHVDRAINIPVDAVVRAEKRLGAKDRTIVVYCASGTRARTAVARMRALGYTRVFNMGTKATVEAALKRGATG